MKQQTASIRFVLRDPYTKGTKNPNPKPTRIYLIFTLDRNNRCRLKTDHSIPATWWDFDMQQPKKGYSGGGIIKNDLDRYRLAVMEMYDELKRKHGITRERIIKSIEQIGLDALPSEQGNESELFTALTDFIQRKQATLAPNTLKKFVTLHNLLQEYTGHTKQPVSFEGMNKEFGERWETFLGSVKGQRSNTVAKYTKALKQFLKASASTHKVNPQYVHISAPESPVEQVRLTADEFNELLQLDLSTKPHLQRIRDTFALMVYTGQRWSDIAAMKPEQFEGNVWRFVQQKGAGADQRYHEIPFIGFLSNAYAIVKRYGYCCPAPISNQKFNATIKEVCRMAGITRTVELTRKVGGRIETISRPKYKFISAHTGRRSCVSILLDLNYPMKVVMQITGHSKERIALLYDQPDKKQFIDFMQSRSGDMPQWNDVQLKAI